jgi:hypothetical protein
MDWGDIISSGKVSINHSFKPVWNASQQDPGNMNMEHVIDMKLVAVLLLGIFLTSLLAFAVVKRI